MMNQMRSDPTPLYARLEAQLASNIMRGDWPPESRLPTEDELISQYGMSRTTVRKAIQNLVARGLVEIRRGKGTYVAQPKIAHDLTRLNGFVEDMEAVGRSATARVLDKQVVAANDTVRRQLALPPGTQVVRIERLRLSDGLAVSFDETYLPLEIGRQVADDDLETNPIFSLLEEKYQIPLIEAEYQLEAITAPVDVADALGIETGGPIFLIERTSYTTNDRPVDYERLFYRGDLVRFVTRLARRSPGSS